MEKYKYKLSVAHTGYKNQPINQYSVLFACHLMRVCSEI